MELKTNFGTDCLIYDNVVVAALKKDFGIPFEKMLST